MFALIFELLVSISTSKDDVGLIEGILDSPSAVLRRVRNILNAWFFCLVFVWTMGISFYCRCILYYYIFVHWVVYSSSTGDSQRTGQVTKDYYLRRPKSHPAFALHAVHYDHTISLYFDHIIIFIFSDCVYLLLSLFNVLQLYGGIKRNGKSENLNCRKKLSS